MFGNPFSYDPRLTKSEVSDIRFWNPIEQQRNLQNLIPPGGLGTQELARSDDPTPEALADPKSIIANPYLLVASRKQKNAPHVGASTSTSSSGSSVS